MDTATVLFTISHGFLRTFQTPFPTFEIRYA